MSLEIEVEGNPTNVRWLKDGRSLDETMAKSFGNGKFALILPDLKIEDFGRYSVQVSNQAGEAESSAKITELGEKLVYFF